MGGLLRYVARTPDPSGFSFQASGEVFSIADSSSVGYGANGRINVPLADNAALTASLFRRDTPGFVDNTLTGESDQNALSQTGGRLAFFVEPSANVTINLSAMIIAVFVIPVLTLGVWKLVRMRREGDRRGI